MNAARISAIIVKEYHDLKANVQVLMMLLIPIFLAVLYSRMGDDGKEFSFVFVSLFSLTFVTMYVQSMLISEEKEKNTLQALLMSPANTVEIMVGKSTMTVIITIISLVISWFIMDIELNNLGILLLVFILSVVLFLCIGTIVGLISKNLIQTGVYIMPFMFLFGLAPMIQLYFSESWIGDILSYSPSVFTMDISMSALEGSAFSSYQTDLLWLAGWMIVGLIGTFMLLKKNSLSN
ncbi:ABC-2 type transport system permease protein [Terribacillus halophilus]|uniref:ABC-2 type transport system permease protein n=1 Tax=Terribacillus halophilus TaxID=361279 RepID=A0A1G6RIT4_9BACI|nr:ABC transporter permease [Terribacillus halophilus]SDD04570.1 ABC-2 type transport system permease protein [Terribacillus halophilus]